MSNRGSTYVGIVVTVLIIAAVSSIGYYQVDVAPSFKTTSSTTTSSTQTCTPSTCLNVTIVSGASGPPTCYNSCPTNYLYGYSPLNMTVVIGVNATVTWTNEDNAAHTSTSNTGDPASWDSGCLGSACSPATGSFTFTFTVPGTYYYHCDYHPWMEGEIIVEAASSSSSSTVSTTQTSG